MTHREGEENKPYRVTMNVQSDRLAITLKVKSYLRFNRSLVFV